MFTSLIWHYIYVPRGASHAASPAKTELNAIYTTTTTTSVDALCKSMQFRDSSLRLCLCLWIFNVNIQQRRRHVTYQKDDTARDFCIIYMEFAHGGALSSWLAVSSQHFCVWRLWWCLEGFWGEWKSCWLQRAGYGYKLGQFLRRKYTLFSTA